ncbi:AraC family transcriptional regulator [Paenibacillus selenitireducens]|nr:AraC family transcriptional regulator [Paenibacillus selenitireducens]
MRWMTIGSNQYMNMLGDRYPFNLFVPECSGTTIFQPHWHEKCLEIIYMIQGSAEFHIGGTSYIGTSGDLFLIGEGVIHGAYLIDEPPQYYTILLDRYSLVRSDFNSVEYGALLTGKLSLPTLIQPEHENYETLTPIVISIIEEFIHHEPGYESAVKSYLHILLTKLYRFYGCSTQPNQRKQEADRLKMERLKDAISFVEGHYQEQVTLGQAAMIAGMSEYHFCRVFKHTVGRTFNEYVQLYRIGQAEIMLNQTDLSISRIAEQAGFGSIHYFDKLFKRYRGCSPLQYRKRVRNG